MKTDVFNKIKFVIIAAVIILSVALFKLNINSNTLFYKTQELINKMGWFNNRTTTVGSVSLTSVSYYGSNLLTPLESETNYANKVKQVRFGMTTTDITNPEDLMYAVVFDNSNGESTYTEDRYPDEIYDPLNPEGRIKVRLKYASVLDTTNATSWDNQGFVNNTGKYRVLYNDKKIVVEDIGMIPFIGGNDSVNPRKWVGILVDLNKKVRCTSGYTIEDIDYTDASRWGAVSDTTFVMWLDTSRSGTYHFVDVTDEYNTFDLDIEFTTPTIKLTDVTAADKEYQNKNKFNTEFSGNKVTIIDNELVSYVREENEETQKWVAIELNLGVEAELVGNNAIVENSSNDNSIILWVSKENAGTYTFKNVNNEEDTINVTVEFTQRKVNLNSVSKIDVTNFDASNDNSGILTNNSNYTVNYVGNTITIKDNGLVPYIGGPYNTPKKWVGVLVDLGVKVQGVEYNNKKYTVEDVDYTDASRWGATTDTTFVMWLTTDKTGTYRFRNVDYSNDVYDLNIVFTHDDLELITFEPISVANANSSEANIVQNDGKYTVSFENNNVIITDNGVTPYVGGNISTPHKWMGFIVDFGIKVQGTQNYNIEPEDYEYARRWGATTDTAFVMWITPNKKGTVRFASVDYPEEEIELNLDFVYQHADLVSVKGIEDDGTICDETANIGKYIVAYKDDTIRITDNGLVPYIGGPYNTAKKWVGLIVDFGVDVQGIEYNNTKYTIEDIDRTDARRWGATTDTAFVMWLTTDKTGSYRFKNLYYSEDTYDLNIIFDEVTENARLTSARSIDGSLATNNDNSGIVLNDGRYDVTYFGNKITVEDINMIPYRGGNLPNEDHKWVGILVDLGVKVQGTSYNNVIYNIEEVDYTDASRWGATTDTTFVMWVRTDNPHTYRFVNVNDANDYIDIEVEFVQHAIDFVSATSIDMSAANVNDPSEVNIRNNSGRYSVIFDKNNNKVIVNENNMIPYIGGNQSVPKNWVGLLLDFGVDVVSTGTYNIEDVDRTYARRWGATTDTAFIMWLTTDKGGSYTFANREYLNDTYTIDIEFNRDELELVSAETIDWTKAENGDNPGITLNAGRYSVEKENNKIIVTDINMIPYRGGNLPNEDHKWVGILVDLGVKAQGTTYNNTSYNIEDIDYTDASRWGATTDTTFVMWVRVGDDRIYRFYDTSYPSETIDIEVDFKHQFLELDNVSKIDISNIDNPSKELESIVNNYSVQNNGTNITVVDTCLAPFTKNGKFNKWVPILVDFGFKVEGVDGYQVTDASYSEALTYGATTSTTFVMWINPDESGSYTFRNVNNSNDTFTINIDFNDNDSCNLNPYDSNCPKLDAPLSNRIHLGQNEQLITSMFTPEVDLENGIITLVLNDNIEYLPGDYKLYVWPTNNREGVQSADFNLLENYYYFEFNDMAEHISGNGSFLDNNNTWKIFLKDVENISLSLINLDSAIVYEGEEEYDLVDNFEIVDYEYESGDETQAFLYVQSRYIVDQSVLMAGHYTLNFSYSNPAYSNAMGTIEISVPIDIRHPDYNITNVSSTSHRLSSRAVYYEFMNYDELNGKVTIKVENEVKELDYLDFISSYSGIDVDALTYDENGDVLYPFNAGILIKNITSVEGVDTVNFYNNLNELQSIPYSEFVQNFGNLNFNRYKFENDKIAIRINAKYREYEQFNRTIGYSDGGKFVFTVDYDIVDPTEFNHIKSLKLVHNNDGVYSDEEFVVYHVDYERAGRFGEYSYTRYQRTTDDDADNSFDLSYDVDTDNNTITFYIIYDNNEERYMGSYTLTMELFNTATYTKNFTIEESPIDFYLASTIDKHEASIEPLLTTFPQGNKQYEYYLSLRMVKGNIDPISQYSADNMDVKIYSKPANLDENNNIYLYDQQDYVVKIINYKNSIVTYDYSTEIDKVDSDRTYVRRVETLDGTSDFETLYTNAYALLNKYIFDEDGNIDTSSDNYDKSIIYKKRENNIDYIKYRDNNEEHTVQANNYVFIGGNLDTLLTAFKNLDFDENGNIVVGSIIGSYITNTYPYDESYDVTNLFNITINEDTTDINHAIKILPKTEVNGGVYYTYVEYNSVLYGVGYVNNIVANGGAHASLDDVVIKPEVYPSLWDKNIHMSTITYLDPSYNITIGDTEFSNSINDSDSIYSNVSSQMVFEIKPKDIFNYSDITYKLVYKNNLNEWVDVDTNKYSYILATKNGSGEYEEIADIASHNNKYYVVMTTDSTLDSGDYRFVVEYTNPNNNVSLETPVYYDLSLAKFYGLTVSSESDTLSVAHNDSQTKNLVMNGLNIDNPENINVKFYYIVDNNPVELTEDNGSYYFTIGNTTTKYFDTTYEVINDTENPSLIKYVLSITNVKDVTQIGNYQIEFEYTEANENTFTTQVTYTIDVDQSVVKLENAYPIVQNGVKSFTMDLTTQYVPSNQVNSNYLDITLEQLINNEYVDVTSSQVSSVAITDVTCENDTCTGKVTFNLGNVSNNGEYQVGIAYGNVSRQTEIDSFANMFAWDIEEQSVTSTFTYLEDNNYVSRDVEGIYKSLTNQRIYIKLDTDIYKDNISWSINDLCVSGSNNTCSVSNVYGDLFTATNTTGTNQELVLTPLVMNNQMLIPNGTYALVLYYSSDVYKVVEFEVHSEYIHIEADLTGEYGEASITSEFTTSQGTTVIDGMYTNLNGMVSLPISVTGVDYSRLTRYVKNSQGTTVNSFSFNTPADFAATHTTKVMYEANNSVPAGEYTLVTEYVIDSNESIKFEYSFTIQDYYYDFSILDDIVVYPTNETPKYLYNNKAGKMVFTIQTTNLAYLDRDEYGNASGGKMYTFKNNAKMYNSNGVDVSSYFTFEVRAHSDIAISHKFDIEVSFVANTVPAGTYQLKTFYTMGSNTITRESGFVTIAESTSDFRIGTTQVYSTTPDNLVHSNVGGYYVINYTSNVPNTANLLTVKVKLNNVDKTSYFTIQKNNSNVRVTVPENSNLSQGNYVVVITFDDEDYEVPISLYGAYNPVINLTSSTFEISDGVIYIKHVTPANFTKDGGTLVFDRTYFINNLTNLQSGYRVYNKNGENITNTNYRVGTGTKLYSPGDNTTYTVVLVGDVNQDGGLSLSDVARLFAHTTGKNPITDQNVLTAGQVRGQAISLSDVAKLYNFLQGKVTSL